MDKLPILKIEGISKSFPGVKALDDISLDIFPGEIHAIVGENGAGKSTLIKIIAGVYICDKGTLYYNDKKINFRGPKDARELGISTVYQELEISPFISVAENIFMGRLQSKLGKVFLDWKTLIKKSQLILDELEININPKTIACDLTIGYQQMVEIARALSIDSKIIIFDEPTAVLSKDESLKLFKEIRKLLLKGIGIIYISHRMTEILEIADRITVLRDGKIAGNLDGKTAKYEDIVKMMVGRGINTNGGTIRKIIKENPTLEVLNYAFNKQNNNINFSLYKGEILGFYGLVGSGRTELMRLIYGLDKKYQGTLKINGKEASIRNPQDAIAKGIGFLTEDRRKDGLVLKLDITKNINLSNHQFIQKLGMIRKKQEYIAAVKGVKDLSIKISSLKQLVETLSGGNQQKVIIARWLIRKLKSSILILDEPTRGVDVNSKAEIHSIIRSLAEEGMSIIMVSSDMEEMLTVSDRIIVMKNNEIKGEILKENATEESIILLATS